MKFKIMAASVILLFSGSITAQKLEKAPVNEEFKKFIESETRGEVTGIIPSPTTYVFSDKINKEISRSKSTFPSSFNLNTEGYVSSVKDQGLYGHCWTFAAIGSIESRSMMLGFDEADLSEQNMATCHGFEWPEGGNQDIATAYLSRLQGPLLETDDPYHSGSTNFSCSSTGLDPQFYVPESRFLPSDPDVIKYFLMNYGAIAVSYHNDFSLYTATNTFYYGGSEGPNHGVLLVGWDDTKSTNGGPGAWIIKNSWGSSWGDNGYFYMSYNDTYAIFTPVIYPIRQELNNIDTILMIDDFGEITSYGFGDQNDYALIKYSVSEPYDFNKIGTYIGASNSIIDIEVFQTKNGNDLEDTLAKKYNIYVEYPGYYTFDVPFQVSDDFYVKIRYNTPADDYPIPTEIYYGGYALADIESDVCWISDEGDEWMAIGSGTDAEADLCIRAYGTKNDIQASFVADYTTVCPNSNVTYTSNSIGTITNYTWDFGTDATPSIASTEGPHEVSYSSEGFKTIKLVIENGSGTKDSLTLYNYVDVNSDIKVIIPQDIISISNGELIDIYAYGAYSYDWTPSTGIIGNSTDSVVTVSPTSDITYTVLGTMGTCTAEDSIKVRVIYAPENDNVCDAIEIPLGVKSGPYSNEMATVEPNEPMPDTLGNTACTDPMKWCGEGGLQNSVWFKFVAPSTKSVNIETDGFDNQIAIYDAESCLDIISGDKNNYTLIAANDDYEDEDYSATIIATSELTEGKTYWLQMDGSNGGKEGEAYITINKAFILDVNSNINKANLIKIYPNPSNGTFKVDLSALNGISDKTNIDVLSIDGSIIYSKKGVISQNEYNFDINRSGMYIVRVTTSSNQYSLPVIIK